MPWWRPDSWFPWQTYSLPLFVSFWIPNNILNNDLNNSLSTLTIFEILSVLAVSTGFRDSVLPLMNDRRLELICAVVRWLTDSEGKDLKIRKIKRVSPYSGRRPEIIKEQITKKGFMRRNHESLFYQSIVACLQNLVSIVSFALPIESIQLSGDPFPLLLPVLLTSFTSSISDLFFGHSCIFILFGGVWTSAVPSRKVELSDLFLP